MGITHLATTKTTATAAHLTKRNGAEGTNVRATTHRVVNTSDVESTRALAAPAATNANAYSMNTHAHHTQSVTTMFPSDVAGATTLHLPVNRKTDGLHSHINHGRRPLLPMEECSVTVSNQSYIKAVSQPYRT